MLVKAARDANYSLLIAWTKFISVENIDGERIAGLNREVARRERTGFPEKINSPIIASVRRSTRYEMHRTNVCQGRRMKIKDEYHIFIYLYVRVSGT